MPWNPSTPGSTSQSDNQGIVGGTPTTLLASAARITSGNQGNSGIDVSTASALALELNVSAVSGTTPSVVVSIDWSNDNVNWSPADPGDSFAAITTVSRRFKNVTVKAKYVRFSWTVSGTTPSLTFGVTGLTL